MITPTIYLHHNDLPVDVNFSQTVAIDTEAMGLNPHRDRLCLVQLSAGDGDCHLVKFDVQRKIDAPHLKRLLSDTGLLKIFHFARFDVALLQHTFGITMSSIYCTKIASKLVRTFIERHGLKDLCRDLLGVDISKTQQSSDWGQTDYTSDQQLYAATDVLYLHKLKNKLDIMLEREHRMAMVQQLFHFIPTCAQLDVLGFTDLNVLQH